MSYGSWGFEKIDSADLTSGEIEMVKNLFAFDPIDRHTYLQTMKGRSTIEPEKKLMFAILKDAVECLGVHKNAFNKKNKALFQESLEWVAEKGSQWIFSFENICEVLELNPDFLRKQLFKQIA